MTNRRNFLKSTWLILGGSVLFSEKTKACFQNINTTIPIGVQLFTFFETIDNDVSGTLHKIADIGYKEIESAFSKKGGYYGMKAKDFKNFLADLGLSWKSHHVLGTPFKLPKGGKLPTGSNGKPISIPPIKNLEENMQEIIDDMEAGGVPYLVCASTPIDSLDEIKKSIQTLNRAAEACFKVGITMAYHNHDKEFIPLSSGQTPYDLLLKETNPEYLKFELDLAWATKGGKDPLQLFAENKGRFPLWHVKDLSKDYQTVMPVGKGVIDYQRIFDNAKSAGMKHIFVEHDMPKDPILSISESYKYLNNTILF